MRTDTIPEKVFESVEEALKHSKTLHRRLYTIVVLHVASGRGLNEVFQALSDYLNGVPLYHNMELSVRDGVIKVILEVSVKNTFENYGSEFKDIGPQYWSDQHVILLSVLDFIERGEEIVDNGYMKYNPAEGF